MVDKAVTVNDYAAMLWTVHLNFKHTLNGPLPALLAEALEDIATSIFLHNKEPVDGDDWTITLNTAGKPDTGEILRRIEVVAAEQGLRDIITEVDITSKPTPDKDWLQHVHENFPPIKIGSFFIYGSHYKDSVPKGVMPLQIDAATAFGSGEHETTRGCILALEFLKKNHLFKNGLDMGCGSGILAIAMTQLWPGIKVTAVDIDPESVVVTERHAKMNNALLHAAAGDGYNTPLALQHEPYDIVVANILANPLISMAPALSVVLQKGGYAILSGLLTRQKLDVVAAHEKQRLKLVHVESIGEWQALVLQKDH